MNKILYCLFAVVALASCGDTYNIKGSSNLSTLDGQKLYLKITQNNDLKNLDSCDVVHGQFNFAGSLDSVVVGMVFSDDDAVTPVVLEGGSITIKIDNTQQSVSGTPLNDKLNSFLKSYSQLQGQQAELVHQHDQAIMNGSDMDAVNKQLNAKSEKISDDMDQLFTKFVTDNFDNVLAPWAFSYYTSNVIQQFGAPVLTPWIEDIMSKATPTFKQNPYVQDYYSTAQHNESVLNGTAGGDTSVPAPDVNQAPAPETPNQMAGGNKEAQK